MEQQERQRFQMIMIEMLLKSTFVRRQIYGNETKKKSLIFSCFAPLREPFPVLKGYYEQINKLHSKLLNPDNYKE